MDKVLISEKSNKTSKELSDFLRAIADKIDEGQLTLTHGQKSVQVDFPENLGFRFKIKDDISRNQTKRKVQIGFRWRTDKKAENMSSLKIS